MGRPDALKAGASFRFPCSFHHAAGTGVYPALLGIDTAYPADSLPHIWAPSLFTRRFVLSISTLYVSTGATVQGPWRMTVHRFGEIGPHLPCLDGILPLPIKSGADRDR
jgi:hypothetical protein